MASQSPEPAHRLLILGHGSARTLPLVGDRWIIGRALDCSITLRDPTVSRKHLLLERHGDEFRFEDLGGANPALLDGQPMRGGIFGVGQTLSIGLTRLVLEARQRPSPIVTSELGTVILSREVIDDEHAEDPADDETDYSATATSVLQNMEWAFADLGDMAHAAEPLLELAMGLTGHRCGWIGRFTDSGALEPLALSTRRGTATEASLPQSAHEDARRLRTPHLLRTREGDEQHERSRLLVPMGANAEGLLVLEHPDACAPTGQPLLQLAQTLGRVVWQRLQETMERERLRTELQRLSFRGSDAHNTLQASSRLQDAREQARDNADDARPMLLIGEPGTEREDLARYLHSEGARHTQPFLSWSGAGRTPGRQRRELFGDREYLGLLERAAGGTLLLDDADRIAAELQCELAVRLARQPAMPRLVLAIDSPACAEQLVDGLRGDSVPAISIPPLRENPRDVLALAELFLTSLGPSANGSARVMTERAKRLLTAYHWPGNVRELRMSIEAAATAAGNQPIAPRHLPQGLAENVSNNQVSIPTLADVERQHIEEVMRQTGGVRARAAQVLGIASSTLYEKLKKFQIER